MAAISSVAPRGRHHNDVGGAEALRHGCRIYVSMAFASAPNAEGDDASAAQRRSPFRRRWPAVAATSWITRPRAARRRGLRWRHVGVDVASGGEARVIANVSIRSHSLLRAMRVSWAWTPARDQVPAAIACAAQDLRPHALSGWLGAANRA